MLKNLTSSLAILVSLASFARADDWPQWRGLARNGISQEKGWLDHFPDQGPPVAWKATVGLGFSSFVVGNTRAYTAGHANDSDTVFCFDAVTGKEVWKQSYPSTTENSPRFQSWVRIQKPHKSRQGRPTQPQPPRQIAERPGQFRNVRSPSRPRSRRFPASLLTASHLIERLAMPHNAQPLSPRLLLSPP